MSMKKLIICCIIVNIIVFFVAIVEFIYIIKYKNQINLLQKNPSAQTQIVTKSSNILSNNGLMTDEYPIDIELEKCCSENYMTSGMNQCAEKAIDDWNKEMIISQNKIKNNLNKYQKELFDESVIAWENYFEKERNFLDNSVGQLSGDIHTTYVMGYLYSMTKERVINLNYYNSHFNK